jgi:hypothetical protein
MAGIEVLSRGAKRSYEQFSAQQDGVDKVLFPIVDMDTTAAFEMDRFIHSAFGIVYRDPNNQSHVRMYQPGTTYLYQVPRASEKTPIGEELRDSVITGLNPTDPQALHVRKAMDDIVKDHAGGHNLTKWKQALDVIFDGEFYAYGDSGADIDLGIDFSRAAANELTPDFTVDATQPSALKAMQDQLIAQGSPTSNMVCIVGSTWLNDFFSDTAITAYLQANTANQLLQQDMIPDRLKNQNSGLVIHAVYRASNMVAPIIICSYSPGVSYVQYKGASSSDWVTATKAAMFSLDTPMYRIYRGVDVFNESGSVERAVGDIVFDTFHENDPITDYIRSQTRHCFVPGNINHTVVSTGTFS